MFVFFLDMIAEDTDNGSSNENEAQTVEPQTVDPQIASTGGGESASNSSSDASVEHSEYIQEETLLDSNEEIQFAPGNSCIA